MSILGKCIALFFIHGLSLISPGPDFLLVFKYSLLDSKKNGIIAASGIIFGNIIFVSLITFLIYFSNGHIPPIYFNYLKYIGGIYLIYVGSRIIISRLKLKVSDTSNNKLSNLSLAMSDNSFQVFRVGLFSTLLNGKAAAYFFSVVPQFIIIENTTPLNTILYLEFIILSTIWFLSIANLFASLKIKDILEKYLFILDMLVGWIFLVFGFLIIFF